MLSASRQHTTMRAQFTVERHDILIWANLLLRTIGNPENPCSYHMEEFRDGTERQRSKLRRHDSPAR